MVNSKPKVDQPIIVTPDYWEAACKHLSKKDRVMRRLIPQFGDACLQSRGDAFITLARSIVGQQISVKAAQTVWDRFILLTKKLTPANILKMNVDEMRAAGLSARKVEYLVDLAVRNKDDGIVNVCSGKPISIRSLVEQWISNRESSIKLILGHFPYPDYESMAFWGNSARIDQLEKIR